LKHREGWLSAQISALAVHFQNGLAFLTCICIIFSLFCKISKLKFADDSKALTSKESLKAWWHKDQAKMDRSTRTATNTAREQDTKTEKRKNHNQVEAYILDSR
jgi:hypothetical protein